MYASTAIALDFDDTRRSRSVGVTVHVAPPTRPSTSKLKSTGKKTTHKVTPTTEGSSHTVEEGDRVRSSDRQNSEEPRV